MERTALRRTSALIISASLLASLTVVAAAPAAAQVPTCDGRPATITDNDGNDTNPAVGFIDGTGGPDVIVGTPGTDIIDGLGSRDIICGLGGNDAIEGGPGNDRIFGGSGDDLVVGEGGQDTIFGYTGDDEIFGDFMEVPRGAKDVVIGGAGNDSIFGGGGPDVLKGNGGSDDIFGNRGNDSIDGGAAVDWCLQGPGSGPIRRCEKADLVVSISSPARAPEGTIAFKVRVTNRGPNAVSYFLSLDENNKNARCDGPQSWEPGSAYPVLKSGASRTRTFAVTCVNEADEGEVPRVWVVAKVVNDGRETRRANNGPRRSTTIIE